MRSGQLITDITLQPKFPIICNGVKICDYIADFSYVDHKTGALTVEDTKGFATPVYRLKKRLFAACYPALKLVEIKA